MYKCGEKISGKDPYTGNLSGTSGYLPGLWGGDRPGKRTDARKEKPGNPKIGLFPVCRIGRDYRSSQVSFSGSKKRYPSGLSEDHGSDRRRRGHGGRA